MRTKITILLYCGFCLLTNAQDFIGYDSDNYSGVHSISNNPANIADSKSKVDINLISFSTSIANDYLSLSMNNVRHVLRGESWESLPTFANINNQIIANVEVLGPSFSFNLNEKHSVGLISRLRVHNSIRNIDGLFLEGILDEFSKEDFNFSMNNLDVSSHLWGEIGLAYGRVIFNDYDRHFLKAGLTLKYLMGASFAQANTNSFSGSYDSNSDLVNMNGEIDYLSTFDDDGDDTDYINKIQPGFGMDIGFIYEYRTRNSEDRNYNNPKASNKYRFKLGLSLLDFGAIKYKNVEQTIYDTYGSVSATDLEEDLVETIENNFEQNSITGDLRVALPTKLRLQFDYKIIPRVYVNIDYQQDLQKNTSPYLTNGRNYLTLTPRFESRLLGIYLPINYSQLGKTTMGVGLKLGPLILGSGSLLSNIMGDEAQLVNVYFGLKIPWNYRN
ncbi:MAG: DUF5723 family protein [Flavobacteriaceae bacterium]|nr:DUF5723 family protein [Flavobacteriaceae bacterium]